MIPISTDAPIYHYPIATVAVMVLNVIMFATFCVSPRDTHTRLMPVELPFQNGDKLETEEDFDAELARLNNFVPQLEKKEMVFESTEESWFHLLSIRLGAWRPWQWVTSNFVHDNFIHLVSNLIFLWAFGLIVEGKVGAGIFVLIYVAVGTLYGGLLQTCSLVNGWEGYAMGANAAIFGLLALCVAWAPANEFTLAWRFGLMDITILMYGFIYVVSEGIGLAIRGFAMSTELLHIMGFAIAFPLGLWMVRAGLVDCEGWDLFSYLHGTTGKDSKVGQDKIREREKKAAEKEKLENQKANLLAAPEEQGKKLQSQVEQAIDQGEFALAIKIQNRIASSNQTVGWRQLDLYRVIQGLLKAKNYAEATPMMELYIESFDANRFEMQVSLIKIWLQAQRPRKALEYMQGLNQAFLAPLQIEQLQKLATYARKQIADGIVEVR